MPRTRRAGERDRIVIVGSGFGGAYAAQKLCRRVVGCEYDLTVLDRNNFLLFYPLLVEAGVGAIEPRHVVVPLRRFMPGAEFVMAEVTSIDLATQSVHYRVVGTDDESGIHYDHLILSLGSVTRIPPIPGLKEFGFELKTLTDAVQHRDRGIRLLELANTIKDRRAQRDLLRHIVVGANFTGVEFAGEYHAFLTDAARDYRNVDPSDIEMILLEYGDRILPSVQPELAAWAHRTLERRGVKILTKTSISEVTAENAVLTNGFTLATQTVLWAAGIAPNPLIAHTPGLTLNAKGYIECESDLRVKGLDNVWAVGDCATVYAEDGKPYAATAQTASRQGPLAAKNVVAAMKGEKTKPFIFRPLGAFAAIGHRSAAAEFLGRNFTGFFGWFLYRGTYLMKMPTLAMKIRLGMDWFLELILPSEPVQLGVHRVKVSPPVDPESGNTT